MTSSKLLDRISILDFNPESEFVWMRDKTADFKTRQNSRFSKRRKTADFQNGTKQPIFQTEQNERCYSQCA